MCVCVYVFICVFMYVLCIIHLYIFRPLCIYNMSVSTHTINHSHSPICNPNSVHGICQYHLFQKLCTS